MDSVADAAVHDKAQLIESDDPEDPFDSSIVSSFL